MTDNIQWAVELLRDTLKAIKAGHPWSIDKLDMALALLDPPKPQPDADADGWIEHTGDECPCDLGILVDWKIRSKNSAEPKPIKASSLSWNSHIGGSAITHWRPHVQKPSRDAQIAAELHWLSFHPHGDGHKTPSEVWRNIAAILREPK